MEKVNPFAHCPLHNCSGHHCTYLDHPVAAPVASMTDGEVRAFAHSADPFVRRLALSALAGSEVARLRLAQEIAPRAVRS